MRFGLTPLSIELIMEKVLVEKGLKGLSEFHFSEIIRAVAEAGYQHCELSLDIFQIFPISIDKEDIKELKTIKKEHDITYSAHFPLLSIDLASPNKFIRQGSIEATINAYELLKDIEEEIDIYILHPTGEIVADNMKYVEYYPEVKPIAQNLFSNYSVASIKEFIERTGINRKKLAIENIIFPFDTTIEIIEELDVNLCIDTAHLLAGFSGSFDLLEITEEYLRITREIHLQDYKEGYIREHSPLGTGDAFPPKFLKFINENHFDGPVVFELLHEEVLQSLEYIKNNVPEIQLPNIRNKF